MLCDEDECATSFEASFELPINGVPIKVIICMNFDNTKAPQGLEGKELCFEIISADIPPYQDWDDNLSFFITSCNTIINSTDDSIPL